MTPLVGWSALIAGLCVLLQADRQFAGSPRVAGPRWRLAFTGYAVCHLTLLAGLSLALIALSKVLVSLPMPFMNLGTLQVPGAGVVGGSLSPLPTAAPLVAALFLIVGLPNLPLARTIERSMRRFFRSLGGVPLPALGLSRLLRRGPFFLPIDLRAEIGDRLAEQGLPAEAILAAPPGDLRELWRRCLVLQVLLEDFTLAHPTFKHGHRQRLEASHVAARQFARLAALLFDGAPAFPEEASRPTLRRLLKQDLRAHLAELAELAALGLIERCPDTAARARELAAWGFGPEDPRVVRLQPRRDDGAAANSRGSVVLPFPASGFAEGKRRLG